MMIVSWGGPLKINYEITEWHKGSFVFKNAESTEKLPILSCGTSPRGSINVYFTMHSLAAC